MQRVFWAALVFACASPVEAQYQNGYRPYYNGNGAAVYGGPRSGGCNGGAASYGAPVRFRHTIEIDFDFGAPPPTVFESRSYPGGNGNGYGGYEAYAPVSSYGYGYDRRNIRISPRGAYREQSLRVQQSRFDPR